MPLRFDVISLFPQMFAAITGHGITARAISRGLAQIRIWNPRDYAHDVHRTVDDRPYGGGPGMVLMAGPLTDALADVQKSQATEDARGVGPVILFSPNGRPINQSQIERLSQGTSWTLVCGRYEGVDQRFIDQSVHEIWSLGDFVLSGGELAAMAVMDAAMRRLPGALGDDESSQQESFAEGLLDWPHFTRPEEFAGLAVPEVLLSGHHERIAVWRRQAALAETLSRRPDLIEQARADGHLSEEDERFLKTLG